MDLIKEIRDLESKGVFIHIDHEHYTNGSNCIWSIEFTRFRDKNNQTGGYGDNHEFGDTIDCYEAAFRLANFLLEGDNLKWYFLNKIETVTKEGKTDYEKHREIQEQAQIIVYKKD